MISFDLKCVICVCVCVGHFMQMSVLLKGEANKLQLIYLGPEYSMGLACKWMKPILWLNWMQTERK